MEAPREKCAVFGVSGCEPGDAARITFFGLHALQHRGQEGSGIVSSDGTRLAAHRKPGLVHQVYNEEILRSLGGTAAIGHNRYATSGGSATEHLQPVIGTDNQLALAHNGNLPSTKALEGFLAKHGIASKNHTDSELMAKAIKYYLVRGKTLRYAVTKAFPLFTGAFSLLCLTKDTLIAVRDACGIRPLVMGRLSDGGYVFSSETCGLDIVGATFIREVEPGEMVCVTGRKLESKKLAPADQKLDVFEFIYFSRPDSMLLGKSVHEVRKRLGAELFREAPVAADCVVPVPDSGIPAAQGYAEASGLPFSMGLVKNRYIGRTFITPHQKDREALVRMKLNPIRETIRGKRIVLIDDSIVRGTTSVPVIRMLREAGAREIHFRVTAPPFRYPDFYGMDVPSQSVLIAFTHSLEEIRQKLEVDSLAYISYEGLITATELNESQLCTSCFTGVYPIPILERMSEVEEPPQLYQ